MSHALHSSALLALLLAVLSAGCGGDDAQASINTKPRQAPTALDEVSALPPADPGLERYERDQLMAAVAGLPPVQKAAWASDSTLVVHLRKDVGLERAELCPTVERYVALRATRLQLQAHPDSGKPVRFLQCRAY